MLKQGVLHAEGVAVDRVHEVEDAVDGYDRVPKLQFPFTFLTIPSFIYFLIKNIKHKNITFFERIKDGIEEHLKGFQSHLLYTYKLCSILVELASCPSQPTLPPETNAHQK